MTNEILRSYTVTIDVPFMTQVEAASEEEAKDAVERLYFPEVWQDVANHLAISDHITTLGERYDDVDVELTDD